MPQDDDMVHAAARAAMQGQLIQPGRVPPQSGQITLEQLREMTLAEAQRAGQSLQGWADLVRVGVVTPEQAFDILFKGKPPDKFEGSPNPAAANLASMLQNLKVQAMPIGVAPNVSEQSQQTGSAPTSDACESSQSDSVKLASSVGESATV